MCDQEVNDGRVDHLESGVEGAADRNQGMAGVSLTTWPVIVIMSNKGD